MKAAQSAKGNPVEWKKIPEADKVVHNPMTEIGI
jgi:hypothetical protein